MPFGIVSIVYAAQVQTKLEAGDHAGALRASNSARNWALLGFAVGVLGTLAYLALIAMGVLAEGG
jgi:hypothetical protein